MPHQSNKFALPSGRVIFQGCFTDKKTDWVRVTKIDMVAVKLTDLFLKKFLTNIHLLTFSITFLFRQSKRIYIQLTIKKQPQIRHWLKKFSWCFCRNFGLDFGKNNLCSLSGSFQQKKDPLEKQITDMPLPKNVLQIENCHWKLYQKVELAVSMKI